MLRWTSFASIVLVSGFSRLSTAAEPAGRPSPARAPAPASDEKPRRFLDYRWQLVIPDAVAAAVLLTTVGLEEREHREGLAKVGVSIYALGGPITHLAHGQRQRAFESFGLRALAPLVTGFAGILLGAPAQLTCSGERRRCNQTVVGGIVGAAIGGFTAMVVDDAYLGKVPLDGASVRAGVVPMADLERKSVGLSMVGNF